MDVNKGKIMEQPRRCPHCGEEIPIDHGFHFDKKGNVVCDKCSKVVLKIEDDNFVKSTEE